MLYSHCTEDLFVDLWIMELMPHKLWVNLFRDLSKQSYSNRPKACRMKWNKLIYFPSTDPEVQIMTYNVKY